MAHRTAPCCEIRTLVLHTYPDGIKADGHERTTTAIGRRDHPVGTLRFRVEPGFSLFMELDAPSTATDPQTAPHQGQRPPG